MLFKISCVIFWLVWMCTLSFMFGMTQYQNRFSYLEPDDPSVLYVSATFSYAVVLAFLGCCCVKCDITHIFCSMLYVVFTAIILTGLCAYVLLKLEDNHGFNVTNYEILKRTVDKFQGPGNQLPSYLERMERHYNCCGILGFKDYRAFVFSKNLRQDVPLSCCRIREGYRRGICPDSVNGSADPSNNTTLFDIYVNLSVGNYTLPIPMSSLENKVERREIFRSLYGNGNPTSAATDPDLWLLADKSKSKNIKLKGCYKYMQETSETIRTAYVSWCIVLIFSGFLMSIIFIQNCFKARHAHYESIQDVIQDSIEQKVIEANLKK